MRTEATDNEWKQLYELAARFQEQKPWEWLTPKDLFAVSFFLGDSLETAYLSISGNEGYSYGVSIYLGISGLNNWFGLWEGETLEIDPEYLLAEQNDISMVLTDEENVPPEQTDILTQLGLQFEADKWIYFERHEPGYFPYPLNQSEVQYAIHCLTGLLEALTQYPKQLPQEYQPMLPLQQFQFPSFEIPDSKQSWILQNTKQTKQVWEMDYCPFSKRQTKEGYEKPVRPWTFFLANRTERLPITHSLVLPKDAPDTPSRRLIETMLEHGRPRELLVPNALVRSYVADLCGICGIQLTIRDTPYCWKHLAELEKDCQATNDDPLDEDTEFWAKFSFQEQELQNRQQKIQAVKDFFGQGSLPSEEYKSIEKSIETAWCNREWKDLVLESTRSQLIRLLSTSDWSFPETASKEELADLYMKRIKATLSLFGYLLDRQARNALSMLYNDIHADDIAPNHTAVYYQNLGLSVELKQRGWPIKDFYYSAKQILMLFDRSFIDIGFLTRERDWILVLKLFPELDSLLKQELRW